MFGRYSGALFRLVKQVSYSSKAHKSWQEVRIPVPWGQVAGKWWGPTEHRPILCLHGWQDNCGTFDRLIPLLRDDIGFLAIDFPGHGYSTHLPPGMFYHHTVYYLTVNYLIDYFNWRSVYLMGHSLGGVTSFCYSLFSPQFVDFIICLDGSKPMVPKNTAANICRELTKFIKYESQQRSNEEPPSYTFEEIKEKIAQPHNKSVDIKYSHHIAERNIRPSRKYPGKYYFARDPRLKVEPLLNWEQSQIVKNAKNMNFPMLIIKALSGSYYEPKENFYEVMDVIESVNKDFHLHKMEGTHHMHLNNPEELSRVINTFLEQYYVADENKGGFKSEIVYKEEPEKIIVANQT